MTSVIFASLMAITLVAGDAAVRQAQPLYRLQPASQESKPLGISQQYKLAKNGNAHSQLVVGVRYLELRNFIKALYWSDGLQTFLTHLDHDMAFLHQSFLLHTATIELY